LVAYRPDSSSPDSDFIGSYKFEYTSAVGNSGTGGSRYKTPAILIAMAATGASADLVHSIKDFEGGGGTAWAYRGGADKSGKTIKYLSAEGNGRWEFVWKDRNSGVFTRHPVGGGSAWSFTSSFIRLDG
jgi:hypothetical protein